MCGQTFPFGNLAVQIPIGFWIHGFASRSCDQFAFIAGTRSRVRMDGSIDITENGRDWPDPSQTYVMKNRREWKKIRIFKNRPKKAGN